MDVPVPRKINRRAAAVGLSINPINLQDAGNSVWPGRFFGLPPQPSPEPHGPILRKKSTLSDTSRIGSPSWTTRDRAERITSAGNQVDAAHYEAYRKLLEAQRPDVVFTHWPIDNHADHRAISMLTYDAWLKMGKGFALYYYKVSNGEDTVHFSPSHYVNISQTEPRKRLACYAHASQSPDKFYALQELVTRMRGIESGHRRAEGYIRHVQSPDFALPLA